MSHNRPHMVRAMLAMAFGMVASAANAAAATGKDVLNAVWRPNDLPSFSQRYGNNPRSHNGGQKSGAAAIKRAARRRRNIRARSSKRGAR